VTWCWRLPRHARFRREVSAAPPETLESKIACEIGRIACTCHGRPRAACRRNDAGRPALIDIAACGVPVRSDYIHIILSKVSMLYSAVSRFARAPPVACGRSCAGLFARAPPVACVDNPPPRPLLCPGRFARAPAVACVDNPPPAALVPGPIRSRRLDSTVSRRAPDAPASL